MSSSSSTATSPAERAARAAMEAVTAGDRATWLHTYADDAVVHDPVGGSPLDPDASGLRGRLALERLWDLTIEPNDVSFTIAAVHPNAQGEPRPATDSNANVRALSAERTSGSSRSST